MRPSICTAGHRPPLRALPSPPAAASGPVAPGNEERLGQLPTKQVPIRCSGPFGQASHGSRGPWRQLPLSSLEMRCHSRIPLVEAILPQSCLRFASNLTGCTGGSSKPVGGKAAGTRWHAPAQDVASPAAGAGAGLLATGTASASLVAGEFAHPTTSDCQPAVPCDPQAGACPIFCTKDRTYDAILELPGELDASQN